MEEGGIAGKEVFGKRNGTEWAVWYASNDCLKLVLELDSPLQSVKMSIS